MGDAAEVQYDDHDETGAIDLDALRQAGQELIALAQKKADAAEAYTTACEAVAQKAGLEPSVVKAWVKTRLSDKPFRDRRKAAQLSMVFEQLG